MIKEYLKETAKEYIQKYPARLNKFINEFEADESDFIEREIDYFWSTLCDIENSEGSHDGYSMTGFSNFSNAWNVCEEIGWEKFRYSTNKKIKFLEERKKLPLETHSTTPKAKPHLGEYTNSQLVLIFYYFFKYSGIEPRVSIDIAPIAKFLHLITGKEFSNTQSSDFYKKLSKAPNHVGDKGLIQDLNHIKPLFQKVELNEIVKMIDNEIDQCRTALKETKTGKR